MARRRMFSKTIVLEKPFIDLKHDTQLLYHKLLMVADDDGFLLNPLYTTENLGFSKEDFSALCENGFVIPFDSGVAAIRHWRVQNNVPPDRYTPTECQKEFCALILDAQNTYNCHPLSMADSCAPESQKESPADMPGENEERAGCAPASVATHAQSETNAPGNPALPSVELCRRWNDTATNCPKINAISGQREKLLRARWNEHPDIEWWQKLFDRVARSSFLSGKNDRAWKATFDWLIKPVNMDKVIGGNYDDRKPVTPQASGTHPTTQSGGFDMDAYSKMVHGYTPHSR